MGTRERLVKFSNAAVIVGFVVFATAFAIRYHKQRQLDHPHIGEHLPALQADTTTWNTGEHVVLVLQKGCHFCEESAPFYGRLLSAQKAGKLKGDLLAILPNQPTDSVETLTQLGLPIPHIDNVPISKVLTDGTPTLMLVDRERTIRQMWVGKLNSGAEQEVLGALVAAP